MQNKHFQKDLNRYKTCLEGTSIKMSNSNINKDTCENMHCVSDANYLFKKNNIRKKLLSLKLPRSLNFFTYLFEPLLSTKHEKT